MTEDRGRILSISYPLAVAEGMQKAKVFDAVRVGEKGLLGEITEVRGDRASIRLYENGSGLGRGDQVVSLGEPITVELGPGMLGGVYDGMQRPLADMIKLADSSFSGGLELPSLDREKIWSFETDKKFGDKVVEGDVYGIVKENESITLNITVPAGISGTIIELNSGDFHVDDRIGKIKLADGTIEDVMLMQRRPMRRARPFAERCAPCEPLVTGQRAIDTLFPIAKGGVACVSGGCASGKTVLLQQIAKQTDADIVIYVACGERGTELSAFLEELSETKYGKTGKSLSERTVVIACTSDMPIAARIASIYKSVTIAEYYRDMGFSVALITDSLSRYAQALRETAENPSCELVGGYPAELESSILAVCERAGSVICLGSDKRRGSVTMISSVSLGVSSSKDPVLEAFLRGAGVLIKLDAPRSHRAIFPTIDPALSYSLYRDRVAIKYRDGLARDWPEKTDRAQKLLRSGCELEEKATLSGACSLSDDEMITLKTARLIKKDFIGQNSTEEAAGCPETDKQIALLRLILLFDERARGAVKEGADAQRLCELPILDKIGEAKKVGYESFKAAYAELSSDIRKEIASASAEQ